MDKHMSQKEVLDALAALEGDEIQVYFIGQRLADEPFKRLRFVRLY